VRKLSPVGFTLRFSLACAPLLMAGCVIEPFADPIPVPRPGPVPASYSHQAGGATVPTTGATQAIGVGATTTRATTAGTMNTGTTIPPVATATRPAGPVVIDEKTRDQIGQAARDLILKRYPAAKDAKVDEYLVLVGSLVTVATNTPNADYLYVLVETDQAFSGAIGPKTILISRGLLNRMDDEAELAGVLAREISNLGANRGLKAVGYVVGESAGPAPAAEVATAAGKLAEVVLKDSLGAELDQAADLEGARLAAKAKYAPDGYLRLLTRMKPGAEKSAEWARVKALDANVGLITKAHPAADVRLPVRFEGYVRK